MHATINAIVKNVVRYRSRNAGAVSAVATWKACHSTASTMFESTRSAEILNRPTASKMARMGATIDTRFGSREAYIVPSPLVSHENGLVHPEST